MRKVKIFYHEIIHDVAKIKWLWPSKNFSYVFPLLTLLPPRFKNPSYAPDYSASLKIILQAIGVGTGGRGEGIQWGHVPPSQYLTCQLVTCTINSIHAWCLVKYVQLIKYQLIVKAEVFGLYPQNENSFQHLHYNNM